MFSLFSRNRQRDVQNFVLNLINNRCPGRRLGGEELRLESRVNLTLVVLVVPIENGRLQVDRRVFAVSKEFSSTGTSLVLDRPQPFGEVILGFERRNSLTFVLGEARHLDPMGGGFFQMGFRLRRIVSTDEYPELESIGDHF
ncbi:MAG: hypothetical protein JW888_12785 [Pirellulales bacterium]|nr:hypothetical protein [Pirellulales bacterium]